MAGSPLRRARRIAAGLPVQPKRNGPDDRVPAESEVPAEAETIVADDKPGVTKYSKALAARIIELVETGMSLPEAGRAVNVHRSTIWKWRKKYRDFDLECSNTLRRLAEALVHEALEVLNGNYTTDEKRVVAREKIRLAGILNPQFSERRRLDVEATVKPDRMDDAELDGRIKELVSKEIEARQKKGSAQAPEIIEAEEPVPA